jgi:2-dehydropantoate 2-reductase
MARVEHAAKPWESAGFKVRLFADIRQMVWEKLILNVAFSGSACLTGRTIGEIMASAEAWQVARACAEEAVAVARAAGIVLDVGDPIEHIRRLGGKIPNARPSLLLDHLAQRRSEIDAINGAIPRLGRPLGVATPVNETVVALVKLREAGFAA